MSFLPSINNPIKRVLVSGMIALTLLTIFPQKAHAQYTDIANSIKEYVADPLAYFVATQIIKKVTATTVNWINSGFKGNPAYVTDPGRFFLDVGDNIASDFLTNSIEMNRLCSPFKAEVRLTLVRHYLSEDSENYTCSLSKIKDNYDAFMQDFSVGGWEGWFEMTQIDSNNPYGSYLSVRTELNERIDEQVAKLNDQLNKGLGFLNFEKCKPESVLSQSDIDSLGAEGAKYKAGDCWINPQTGVRDTETQTPGSVINNQLNKVLSSGQNRLEAADEVDEIIGALLNQLLNKAMSGLKGLSKGSNSEKSYSDSLRDDPSDEPSNPNAGSEEGPLVTCVTGADGVMVCKATAGNGGLAACTLNTTGHGNDAGVQPIAADLSNVVFELTDVSKWPVNGNLSGANANDDLIHFDHDRPGSWNAFDVKKEPNDPTFASAWIFVWRKNAAPLTIDSTTRTNLSNLRSQLNSLKSAFADDDRLLSADLPYSCPNGNCARFNFWKGLIESESGINETIGLLERSAPQSVMNRISSAMADLKEKNADFMQVIRDNREDFRPTDELDQIKVANEGIDIINRLYPLVDELVNPPPAGSGKWHAFPFAYLTLGHPNEREVDYTFCGGIGGSRTLGDFNPTAGDVYGFMLSTPARDTTVVGNSLNVRERTNIITYTWPTGITRPKKSGDLPTPGGGGPSGHCVGPDNNNFQSQVDSAVDAVVGDTAFSSLMNTEANSEAFVVRVRDQLINMGLTAFSGVMSGNDVMHYDNKVGVQENSSIVERYEIVNGAGDGNVSLATAADSEYLNDIPIDCVDPASGSGGGGGGGGGATTGTIQVDSNQDTLVTITNGTGAVILDNVSVPGSFPDIPPQNYNLFDVQPVAGCSSFSAPNSQNRGLSVGGTVTFSIIFSCP